MKKVLLTITTVICKLTIKACRMANWGGTTLPGRIAQKIYPDILKDACLLYGPVI
jgi:hypothetical protein